MEDENDELQGSVTAPIVKQVSEMSNTFNMSDNFMS